MGWQKDWERHELHQSERHARAGIRYTATPPSRISEIVAIAVMSKSASPSEEMAGLHGEAA
jgi:hypothetical protein